MVTEVGALSAAGWAWSLHDGLHRSSNNKQELINRWDSEREFFYDDIIHVEASAYAHWTHFYAVRRESYRIRWNNAE